MCVCVYIILFGLAGEFLFVVLHELITLFVPKIIAPYDYSLISCGDGILVRNLLLLELYIRQYQCSSEFVLVSKRVRVGFLRFETGSLLILLLQLGLQFLNASV
ncbi:hypothetical protein BDV19DRAFT_178075 [Aspergillus venezuelensis]